MQLQYIHSDLGLHKNATIDVVVVDNGGYFSLTKLEKKLPEGVNINSFKKIKPNLEQEQKYAVCFLPAENKLCIKGRDSFDEYDPIFNPMNHSDDLMESALPTVRYG